MLAEVVYRRIHVDTHQYLKLRILLLLAAATRIGIITFDRAKL